MILSNDISVSIMILCLVILVGIVWGYIGFSIGKRYAVNKLYEYMVRMGFDETTLTNIFIECGLLDDNDIN